MLGIDPDERMAALAGASGIEVEVARLEDWEAGEHRFDLVIAGQSWHWVDPTIGATRAAGLLDAGGRLAPFWNYRHPSDELEGRVLPIYERLAPSLLGHSPLLGTVDDVEELARYAETIGASGAFARLETRRFPWTASYTTADWLGLSRTQSDHRLLGEEALELLLAAVAGALGEDGPWTVRYESAVVVAELDR